jgi:hypothetical protein
MEQISFWRQYSHAPAASQPVCEPFVLAYVNDFGDAYIYGIFSYMLGIMCSYTYPGFASAFHVYTSFFPELEILGSILDLYMISVPAGTVSSYEAEANVTFGSVKGRNDGNEMNPFLYVTSYVYSTTYGIGATGLRYDTVASVTPPSPTEEVLRSDILYFLTVLPPDSSVPEKDDKVLNESEYTANKATSWAFLSTTVTLMFTLYVPVTLEFIVKEAS